MAFKVRTFCSGFSFSWYFQLPNENLRQSQAENTNEELEGGYTAESVPYTQVFPKETL